MSVETWKIGLAPSGVREVEVTEVDGGWQAWADGPGVGGFSRKSARRAVVQVAQNANWTLAEVAAPGELTRAELLARLERAERACAEGLPREVILCPVCGAQHVDGENGAEFATKPHHTHLCSACGHVWDAGRWSYGARESGPSPSRDELLALLARPFAEALGCPIEATVFNILAAARSAATASSVVDRISVAMGCGYPAEPEQVVGQTIELVADRHELFAAIEGRTTPPTEAEIDAHEAAGGLWRTDWNDRVDATLARGLRRDDVERHVIGGRTPSRWWALRADRRLTSWPVVPAEVPMSAEPTETTPVQAVAAVAVRGGRVLLIRSRKHGVALPAGKVQPGESHEAALRREVREETGLEVTRVLRFLCTETEAAYHCHHYEVEVAAGEPAAGDDAEAAWWGEPAEAAQSKFPLVRELVCVALDRAGFLPKRTEGVTHVG